MKSFAEYIKNLNEEGPAGPGPAHAGGPGPMAHGGHHGPGPMGGGHHGPGPMAHGGHHGPGPMAHGGPAGGLGMGFGPAMPRASMGPRPVPVTGYGLSFLTPLNTAWWTMPVWSLYNERWPSDRYGRLINRNLTFADLALALDLAVSPYDAIGTDNPRVVRKILRILAEILGRNYSDISGYRPESRLFSDYDVQLDELSQRLGVLLAPRHY